MTLELLERRVKSLQEQYLILHGRHNQKKHGARGVVADTMAGAIPAGPMPPGASYTPMSMESARKTIAKEGTGGSVTTQSLRQGIKQDAKSINRERRQGRFSESARIASSRVRTSGRELYNRKELDATTSRAIASLANSRTTVTRWLAGDTG